jgi:hypothetical protein
MGDIYTIEEGIEIPRNGAGAKAGSGKWQKLCARMRVTTEDFVGSSIILSGDRKYDDAKSMRGAFVKLGFNIVTRKQGDGLRVWKVAK